MMIGDLVSRLEKEKASIRFSDLIKICREYFGEPRVKGSHHIFKTPWLGDPRLNLQAVKGEAKPYQVKQVIAAIRRLEGVKDAGDADN